MSGSNILSILYSIFIFLVFGAIILGLLFSVFPFLAILLIAGLAYYTVSVIVNRFRAGAGQAEVKKKFDEFGNRRTKATIIGMEDAPQEDTAEPGKTPEKDKKE